MDGQFNMNTVVLWQEWICNNADGCIQHLYMGISILDKAPLLCSLGQSSPILKSGAELKARANGGHISTRAEVWVVSSWLDMLPALFL